MVVAFLVSDEAPDWFLRFEFGVLLMYDKGFTPNKMLEELLMELSRLLMNLVNVL